MSNNIYDILKKMENLEAPKQTLTEGKKAKPDYIDIDKDGDKTEPMKKAAKEKSKGAVAEAVARVEKKLAEKYLNHKKKIRRRV
jgi:tellurite resistance protein